MDFLAVMILVFCSMMVVTIFGWLLIGAFANTTDSISTLLETVYNFVHCNDDASTVPMQKPARYLP